MIKNNAVSDLQTKILPESTSFICKKWEWELFPISNFEVFLEFFENWIVTKRESIFIRERKWDVFLISERWFDFCVQNDLNSRERWKRALEFEIWSKISQYFSENYLKNIEEKIENTENKKLDKNDSLVTQFNSANNLVKLWADWKLPALDGSLLRNIKTSNTSFNLEMVAGENIEAWSFVFVAKENKRKKVFLDNKNLNLQNTFPTWNTVYKINFKKHPGKIKSFQILHNWWWSWDPSFDLYKDERCTQFFLRAGWNSLKTIREWSTESTLYEFKNFSNYDENYDLAWKSLYFKASGFHKNKTIPENNFFSFVWENNPFSYIEFEQEVEKGKIYKADCFDKIDKVYFLKNEAQKWQTVQVVCTWFVENLNLSLDKKDVFLNWIWKVTQVETDLKIWEKITNSIMELKTSEEKLPLNFHNLILNRQGSGTRNDTITINHNLGSKVKNIQALVYANRAFYWIVGIGAELRGFNYTNTSFKFEILENTIESLKLKISVADTPDLNLTLILF